MRINFCLSVLFVSVAAAVGCGGGATERVPVAGKVLMDGQPLGSGSISFVPKLGRPASSSIQPDGSFELVSESVQSASQRGLPRGIYQVQVSSSKVIDDATIQWNAPQKYADFRTSGLQVVVAEPNDHLTIQLSSRDTDSTPLADPNGADSKPTRASSAAGHSGEGREP
jgi:hypothetical protein